MDQQITRMLLHGAIIHIRGAIDDLGTLAERIEWEDGRADLLKVVMDLDAMLTVEFGKGGLKGFME